jgi:methionyl-tRNA formyltransferase
VHPSLLPRWRGAAPIQAALLAGDRETGVSIIRLVQALDAGPILLQSSMPIADSDDYLTLEPRLAQLGADMLVRAFVQPSPGTPQNDADATYCDRIERDDAHIDWSRAAEHIWRQVRAYRGWPQAFSMWDGRLLKILRSSVVPAIDADQGTLRAIDAWPVVSTGDGSLRLEEVVLEGRRPQTGAELLRGYPGLVGAHLS